MSIKLFILFTILSLRLYSQDLSFEWANSIGSHVKDLSGDIITDSENNVYVLGNFQGNIPIDNKNQNLNLISNGGSDVFLAKYSDDGTLIWIKSFGGTGYDYAYSLAIDSQNNVFIVGYFTGTVDFDPSVNSNYLSSNGLQDIFISKFNKNGQLIWVKSFGNSQNELSKKIKVDNQDNVYIAGGFYGTVDFDPSLNGVFNITSGGSSDGFILKLNNDGVFIWAKSFFGIQNGYDFVNDIEFDDNNDLYVLTSFFGMVDFDPGNGSHILNSFNSEVNNSCIVKLNKNGVFEWAKLIECEENCVITECDVDENNNIYIIGRFRGKLKLDDANENNEIVPNGTAYDILLAKYSPNSDFLWGFSLGSNSSDSGLDIKYFENQIYISGLFSKSVDFNPSQESEFILTSNSNKDAFIANYTFNGDFLNAYSFGGIGEDVIRKINITENKKLYALGDFTNLIDCNPNQEKHEISTKGDSDIFFIKFNLEQSNSLFENTLEKNFFYPNPCSPNSHLKFNSDFNNNNLRIKDFNGKIILESKIIDDYFQLNQKLENSIYLLEVINEFDKIIFKDKLIIID
jgi:hypothetical protein